MSPQRRFRLARTILLALLVVLTPIAYFASRQPPQPPPPPEPELYRDLGPDTPISEADLLSPDIPMREVLIAPRHSPAISGVRSYSVVVEKGLAGEEFSGTVDRTLSDERGWSRAVPFRRAGPGETPNFSVVLASPENVDRLCHPIETKGIVSCGRPGMAVINALRWRDGPLTSAKGTWVGLSLETYRTMLVNHEIGHVLGAGHLGCSVPGQPAPVMMQQTISTGDCKPNAWPTEADIRLVSR